VSLLIRIAELVLIVIAVRTFLRMVFPSMRKPRPPGDSSAQTERFNAEKSDISDADYEDVK
jgi:hypothetical protein